MPLNIEDIKKIENKFSVNEIKYKHLALWPDFRSKIFFSLVWKEGVLKDKGKISLEKIKIKFQKLSNFFYGIKNYFRRYDYIFFSNSANRKKIDGKFFDKSFDPIINSIGKENCLLIESIYTPHCPKKSVFTKYIASETIFMLLTHILRFFTIRKKNIKGLNELDNLLKELKYSNFKIKKEIGLFYSSYLIYKLYFKIVKPKTIFVNNGYGICPIIKAAKEVQIKVIEAQHGMIGMNHYGYQLPVKLDSSFFPDYFLSYGDMEKKELRSSFYIKNENVIPIGSYVIDYYSKKGPTKTLQESLNKYPRSIVISGQETIEIEIIDMIIKTANQIKDCLFIYAPRIKNKEYFTKTFSLPDNIEIFNDLSFYDLISFVNFHITGYSSCAIESLSFGIPNIFLNINQLSEFYFKEILPDNHINKYVNSHTELIKFMKEGIPAKKDEILAESHKFFRPRYKENLDTILLRIVPH